MLRYHFEANEGKDMQFLRVRTYNTNRNASTSSELIRLFLFCYFITWLRERLFHYFSRKGEEKQGEKVTLEVGDHLFICTAKEDYVTFADYETYDITQNTLLMRFNYRIYNFETEVNVVNPEYKKFIVHAIKILTKEQV